MTNPNRLSVLAGAINEAHDAAERYGDLAFETVLKAGEALLEAKAEVEHGHWLPWLEANCPAVSTHTAERYMKVAKHRALMRSDSVSYRPTSRLTV